MLSYILSQVAAQYLLFNFSFMWFLVWRFVFSENYIWPLPRSRASFMCQLLILAEKLIWNSKSAQICEIEVIQTRSSGSEGVLVSGERGFDQNQRACLHSHFSFPFQTRLIVTVVVAEVISFFFDVLMCLDIFGAGTKWTRCIALNANPLHIVCIILVLSLCTSDTLTLIV